MKLEKAFKIIINETKLICNSRGSCDYCPLYRVCYYDSEDHPRFQEFPYEILELMRDELIQK